MDKAVVFIGSFNLQHVFVSLLLGASLRLAKERERDNPIYIGFISQIELRCHLEHEFLLYK